MKIRPCIDLHNGKVKQIVGGTLTDRDNSARENFVSSRGASYYARQYRDDKMTGGHIVKLGPGNDNEAEKALKIWPEGMQIGGGITGDNCRLWIDRGASHVIVTSWVFRDGAIDFTRLDELVKLIGKKRLVLDLSCRKQNGKYVVVTDRWQRYTDFIVNRKNIALLESYCDEFLIHAADVEGLRGGIEADLVSDLGRWSSIPVTYAGGARDLNDAEKVKELGRGLVDLTIGSALDIFGGSLAYRDVVQWNRENRGVY
ncbi:phosphoribosylformimino-5-aminoimidazole carboxamide ribotide isomerase [Spirochaeta isovalerica]|uniref:Phosphoribosylformimino-5-aminoimidazole carboxamide ribotide isomerase n=1 Tax=Spirochaeta isovalerica TaxID=150 RepID=A0A841R7V7_9SPIO|nr:phosphoribosylformimino-5-aminoimidazole carboxamide ribotide isomerase [Spirochaeta isovalerica]MBB6481364.1 phosphoribosylformimino-5-aminoimidazole carboxamide ribotide isomerase [Spirochaeta isovalerica]